MRISRALPLDALDWPVLVRPGDLVVWGQASAEPTGLTGALTARRAAIGGFRAFVGIGHGAGVDPAFLDQVRYSSYCGTGENRRLGDALEILPLPYAMLAPTLAAEHPVLLLALADGGDPESFSCAAGCDYLADLIPHARLVIAEISPHYPRTGGATIARGAIDIVVETDNRPPPGAASRYGDVEKQIAGHIAGLVEDGSVLQLGLGAIPAAVLSALADRRDLGIHSGLIGDEVAALAESGAITNARKTVDPGVSVTGLLSGGDRVMHWARDNARLALRPTSYTHDPAVLASIDRLVAINSAIEVDFSGQVNAEIAGGRYVGAIGGGPAFLRGAGASRGGLPIIALPSTAGSRSRIVTRLSGPVSTGRADVGLVVTEHGVADLRHLTITRRRDALLRIADPQLAAELDAGAP